MRLLHVTPAFFPATAFGGPIVSLLGLCTALSEQEEMSIRVLTADSVAPAAASLKKKHKKRSWFEQLFSWF